MASHKILSVIFTLGALMLANAQGFAQTAPAPVQDAAKQNRMQSDFNTMTVLLNACEQRTMTPDQYQSSCTGLANALQQEGITNDEENAQIYAFIQNSTQRCRVVQYYYNQTEAANAAFRSGQISADTLRTMHDAALRILLDSNYITQETYAQKLAELNVQIAQYQQQTAASPQQVQAPQTAASPQQVQAPQTAASPQQVQAPQTSYNPQQERIFQSTVAQQQEYANQAMLFQRYQELYNQTFNDYDQNRISEDEFRTKTAELFDTMVKIGMLTQEQRSKHEAQNEKIIKFKKEYSALWYGRTESMTPKQWAEGVIALADKAESEQVIASEAASNIRNKANDSRKYLEEHELLRTDFTNDKISGDEYLNKSMVIFEGLIGTGYYAEDSRELNRKNIEKEILMHDHWITKEIEQLNDRLASGRMPIRRYEAAGYALIDKAEAEGLSTEEVTNFRQALKSAVDHYNTNYNGYNRRPDNFILKLGANGGAAYYDSFGWKGYTGGHIEFGYLWNLYSISLGLFARQDLNYIFESFGSAFLGMTSAIIRFAGVYWDSTFMISFDIGAGATYSKDATTFSMPLALGLDYYVSDRVGIGLGVNAFWVNELYNLNCLIQPDLHIIIDI